MIPIPKIAKTFLKNTLFSKSVESLESIRKFFVNHKHTVHHSKYCTRKTPKFLTLLLMIKKIINQTVAKSQTVNTLIRFSVDTDQTAPRKT